MKLIDRIGWWGEDLLMGVHLQAQSEEIHLAVCKKQKGGVSILEQHSFSETTSFQQFLVQTPGVPIVGFLSPKVVVEGFVPAGNTDPLTHLMGVSVDNRAQFVQQSFGDFHSIARKEDIEDLLALFGSFAERLIQLFYSPAILAYLLPAMDEYDADQVYQLMVREKPYFWQTGLKENPTDPQALNQSDLAYRLEIKESYLLPYSAVVFHYLSDEVEIKGLPTLVSRRKTQKQFSLWTKALGIVWLCFLLGGGFLFAWYRYAAWQIEENERVAAANRPMLNRIADKDAQIEKQFSFIEGAAKGSLEPTQVTAYLDQLLSLVPRDMYLRHWTLAPQEEVLKKIDAGLIAEAPDILIQGETSNAKALAAVPQDWEKLDFVDGTRIWDAQYDFETQMQAFTLLIWLKDE